MKKDLESLCLNDADCATLYNLLLDEGNPSDFESQQEFAAGLANADILTMLRTSAKLTDKMRELGYAI